MQLLKQYWPSIVHVAAAGVLFLNPSVQAYAASHAAYAAPLLMVWGVVLHHLPSPLGK
jgi:predicted membrane protein